MVGWQAATLCRSRLESCLAGATSHHCRLATRLDPATHAPWPLLLAPHYLLLTTHLDPATYSAPPANYYSPWSLILASHYLLHTPHLDVCSYSYVPTTYYSPWRLLLLPNYLLLTTHLGFRVRVSRSPNLAQFRDLREAHRQRVASILRDL